MHDAAGSKRASSAEMVNTLVRLGADVNARAAHGLTPLHYALGCACDEHLEVVTALLQLGADVHARTAPGLTPQWRRSHPRACTSCRGCGGTWRCSTRTATAAASWPARRRRRTSRIAWLWLGTLTHPEEGEAAEELPVRAGRRRDVPWRHAACLCRRLAIETADGRCTCTPLKGQVRLLSVASSAFGVVAP